MTMRRWAARVALILIALGILFGLWAAPVTMDGKIFFVPSHTRVLVMILACITLVLGGIAILVAFCYLIKFLLEEAE